MLDLVGKRKLWYLISAILLIPGLISLAINGLNLGIDFTGGSSWELQFPEAADTEEVRAVLTEHGYGDAVIQVSDETIVLIRMKELPEGSEEKANMFADLEAQFGDITELGLQTVGPSAGRDIRNRAIMAIVLASVGVMLYIAWAFRNTQNPFLYSCCAIAAMLHDVFLVLGVFSILGWLADVEVDSLFVTAILTIIGFSVHDTIVVFDRIRENLRNHIAPSFDEVVNYSVVQTMVRSINTSLVVVLTLSSLYLFGGASTRWFVFALLLGIVAGTYSSIFNAAQLLVSWDSGEIRRLAFWRRDREARTSDTTVATR